MHEDVGNRRIMPIIALNQISSVWALTRRYAGYLRPVRWHAAFSVGLVIISPVVAVCLLWIIKTLIDEVFVAGRLAILPMLGAAYVITVAAKAAIGYACTRLDSYITETVTQDARVATYKHVVSSSPGTFTGRGVGDLLSHLDSDVNRVEYLVYTGPLAVIADTFGALFFLIVLLLLSWKLTLAALFIVPLLIVVNMRVALRARRSAAIARQEASGWMALAEERLGALPLIHSFGTADAETQTFAKRCTRLRRAELRSAAIQAWLAVTTEAVGTIGGLLVLGIGAFEVSRGNLTIGTFIAFLGSLGSLYSPLRGLAKVSTGFQRAAASAQRVSNLLDTKSIVQDRVAARPTAEVRGALEYRNVSFAYDGGAEVLKNFSLRIEPGETVAIVGASGAGKSTLVKLALRQIDPNSGEILLDGVNLRDIDRPSLRRAIGAVFQEPYVFGGTIADNVRYGEPGASARRVEEFAHAASVDSFARLLRRGLASPVGPRGNWLSGGQRQRIALARALMRESPILLLDEAMAAVDGETEEIIQGAIERLSGRRTILVIAHRLSSIMRADRIVVLDRGELVESGPPEKLLRPGTRCRDLFGGQLLDKAA